MEPCLLEELEELLREGIRLSKQGSYRRRAPTEESLPHLLASRDGILEYLKENQSDNRAWRMLSQAAEVLLDYSLAIRSVERAMELEGARAKPDLKRLALLKDALQEWRSFGLTGKELQELGRFLYENGASSEKNSRTTHLTEAWLKMNAPDRVVEILSALEDRGGFTDFEVLHNVVGKHSLYP